MGSLISVRRSRVEARGELGSDFRRALGPKDCLDRLANHFLSGLLIKAQSGRIDFRVPETPIDFLHDDGVALRGVIEECLDERF